MKTSPTGAKTLIMSPKKMPATRPRPRAMNTCTERLGIRNHLRRGVWVPLTKSLGVLIMRSNC